MHKTILSLFFILIFVRCKPTDTIHSNAIREKTSTLEGALDYQDFTVIIPSDWQSQLDHGFPTYSTSEFGKSYYRNMTKIINLKSRYTINKPLEEIAKTDLNIFLSNRDVYKLEKEAIQTKFGETYSFTFNFKINNNIYKVNRTYFAFNNSYYCMYYRSEKNLFDIYFDTAKTIMFSIKEKA